MCVCVGLCLCVWKNIRKIMASVHDCEQNGILKGIEGTQELSRAMLCCVLSRPNSMLQVNKKSWWIVS